MTMKYKQVFVFIAAATAFHCSAFAQKNIAEATIVYDMEILNTANTPQKSDAFSGATTTVYLKGNNSRTDRVSPLGKEITIFNSKSDNAVILKEYSGQKLMITLTRENWRERNRQSGSVTFELTNEFKNIAGYATRKAIAKTADGKSFEVYYSTELATANKDYDATFTNLPGLPVQYEIESGNLKFKYTVSKISYDPVQVSLFDFPTTGFRIMTYEENQNLRKGN
jgi:GLPGLI family protein